MMSIISFTYNVFLHLFLKDIFNYANSTLYVYVNGELVVECFLPQIMKKFYIDYVNDSEIPHFII